MEVRRTQRKRRGVLTQRRGDAEAQRENWVGHLVREMVLDEVIQEDVVWDEVVPHGFSRAASPEGTLGFGYPDAKMTLLARWGANFWDFVWEGVVRAKSEKFSIPSARPQS